MKFVYRFWSFAIVTITCLCSSIGLVDAGPIRSLETTMVVNANEPIYLQSSSTYMIEQNSQDNMQQMSHYSHSSHSSHYSHNSHSSHYSQYYYEN